MSAINPLVPKSSQQGTEGTAKTAGKIGEPSPEAIDFAKRMIALKWTKETNVNIVAGNWQAGYLYGLMDSEPQSPAAGVWEGKYSWEKIEDQYQVRHKEGKEDTFIAKTDSAEKAHFLAYAANFLSSGEYGSGQEQGQAVFAEWASTNEWEFYGPPNNLWGQGRGGKLINSSELLEQFKSENNL